LADKVEPVTLVNGKPNNIGGNTAMRYRIDFSSETFIEGIIPANSKLTICPCGDIARFDLHVGEYLVKPLTIVDEK
jgi:hypothetical protein